MKVKKKLMSTILAVLLMSTISFASAHYYCFTLYSDYNGYGYTNGRVVVDYKYEQNGTKNYTYRLGNAISTWDPVIGDYSNVSSGYNTHIVSDNYLDSGWVGQVTKKASPKQMRINEYYHINYSNYDYIQYERTIVHEFGHLHGLNHVSCYTEVMDSSDGKNISQTWLGDGDKAGIARIY